MKTLLKALVPCLALLVLISGKSADPEKEKSKVYSVTVTPGGTMKKDFDTCLPQGSQSFCISGLSGTQARLGVNYGFTITSSAIVSISGGQACWTINANQIVEYSLDVRTGTTGSWTPVTGGSCIEVCDQPEQCG